MMKLYYLLPLTIIAMLHPYECAANDSFVDITQSVVIVPSSSSSREMQAARMVAEEVEKRTQIRWRLTAEWPQEHQPRIAIGRTEALQSSGFELNIPTASASAPEGYRIWMEPKGDSPVIVVAGNDERGVLFGAGCLLRTLRMTNGKILFPRDYHVATAPKYALRGHQLGYRPKTNSYDGWTLNQFEQYIRDLAVFGTNAVELIPPRSDDKADSPHFPLPQLETMIGVSEICDRYGLDVWIWQPCLDENYSDPRTIESALEEWESIYQRLPRLDAIFVPCGDPGHTPPDVLLPMLEKQAAQLKKLHPNAQWWIGPQGFDRDHLQKFHDLISRKPEWLTGIVYGPWTRLNMKQFREWIPSYYPIRHYPDITHTTYCQYPVPDWDPAFYLTEGREPINPRPTDQAHIFRFTQPDTMGFIAYSEGCSDDVNKIVWSALGWNPDSPVIDILRDYSRYFIGLEYEDDFAQGLLALERDWRGPALSHAQIDLTLRQFRTMEEKASPRLFLNWRFQQGLFRAYYDAYVRSRLIHETDLENQALSRLQCSVKGETLHALSQARSILMQSVGQPASPAWKQRILELGESLFQSIRLQLDVRRYKAGRSDGAMLDRLDAPLNNRLWLLQQFDEIGALSSEEERLERIDQIVNWKNPGPGGFYDDLGDPAQEPHLVKGEGFEKDPGMYQTARNNPDSSALSNPMTLLPSSWKTLAVMLYDEPLRMKYDNLDPASQYIIRVVYADGPVRLLADESYEVHPFLDERYKVLEYDIPPQATVDGELRLTWRKPDNIPHAGRRNEVAEVWLMKKK
ncbi:MAG: glycoside hydrolase family 20 zincin-like fold domain-containing protein [Candidatus Omnitrophota bacterium]